MWWGRWRRSSRARRRHLTTTPRVSRTDGARRTPIAATNGSAKTLGQGQACVCSPPSEPRARMRLCAVSDQQVQWLKDSFPARRRTRTRSAKGRARCSARPSNGTAASSSASQGARKRGLSLSNAKKMCTDDAGNECEYTPRLRACPFRASTLGATRGDTATTAGGMGSTCEALAKREREARARALRTGGACGP
eukprot:1775587-Pleurochrysis_carterae.AAC.9